MSRPPVEPDSKRSVRPSRPTPSVRAQLAGVVAIIGALLVVDWLWSGVGSSKLGDAGPLLLLAVYVCAAHACARIPRTGPRTAAKAARLLIWVVVAGVIAVEWPPPLGIAAVVLIVAAAIATKTKRLPRTPKAREELLSRPPNAEQPPA